MVKEPIDQLVKRIDHRSVCDEQYNFLNWLKTATFATGYNSAGKEALYEFSVHILKYTGGLYSTTEDLVKVYHTKQLVQGGRHTKKQWMPIFHRRKAVLSAMKRFLASPDVFSMYVEIGLNIKPDTSEFHQIWADRWHEWIQ